MARPRPLQLNPSRGHRGAKDSGRSKNPRPIYSAPSGPLQGPPKHRRSSSHGASRNAVRPQRRCAYRVSGCRRRAVRPDPPGPVVQHVDALWRVAPIRRFVERLATFARVILLDKGGTGISDPVPLGGMPTLEEWMDDIRVVMDAVGSERAALISGAGACYLTLLSLRPTRSARGRSSSSTASPG